MIRVIAKYFFAQVNIAKMEFSHWFAFFIFHDLEFFKHAAYVLEFAAALHIYLGICAMTLLCDSSTEQKNSKKYSLLLLSIVW